MYVLRNARFAWAMVGLIFSWMFFPPVLMTGFFPETRAYTLANETILMFCTWLLVFVVVARRGVERFIARGRMGALGLVLVSLVGYGLLLVGLANGYSKPLALVATFLLALGYITLMMCWTMLLSAVDTRQTFLLLFGSALGYAALSLGNFVPLEGRMLLCGLSTTISGICWLVATRKPATVDGEGAGQAFAAHPGVSYDFTALRHAPFIMLGLLTVLLIGGRTVSGLYFTFDKDLSFEEMSIRCACIAGVMIYCLMAARRGASLEQEYRNAWIPAAGLFLLGAMMLIGLQGAGAYAGLGIAHGALNCFEVIAYLVLFQFIKNDRVSPVMTMGLGLLVFKVLPIALQRLAFPHIIATMGLTEVDVAPLVILMSMAVLVCALTFANNRRTAEEVHALTHAEEDEAAEEPEPTQLTFEGTCLQLANQAGLSTREAEIMLLIARGNSQKHISETLYLALGTVQWYAKTIYRKLGVHSKQELINLVNEQQER